MHALVQLPPEARPPATSSSSTNAEVCRGIAGGAGPEQAATAQPSASELHVQQQAAEREALSAQDRLDKPALMDVRPKAIMLAYYTQQCSALPEVSARQSIMLVLLTIPLEQEDVGY